MPPGPAYNWLCVLSSTVDVLSHAARSRAAQATGGVLYRPSTRPAPAPARPPPPVSPREPENARIGDVLAADKVVPLAKKHVRDLQEAVVHEPVAANIHEIPIDDAPLKNDAPEVPLVDAESPAVDGPASQSFTVADTEPRATAEDTEAVLEHVDPIPIPQLTSTPRNMSSSKVPSSRIGRLFHYGGLAASLGYGAAAEMIRRTGSSEHDDSSLVMTEANIKRLVSKLSQMRGAALKLGQFLSIQDTHMMPPEIDQIFRRVQDSAHYMPDWQMEEVMRNALGAEWVSNFDSFERIPFAAASIGQVHHAVLKAELSPTSAPLPVAVKIQFPNIANSIESDLGYIKMLLTAGRLLPKGLFLDRTVAVMKGELADECDYTREASFLERFATSLGDDNRFKIPWVWDGSTERVLVMEHIDGVSVGEANVKALSQEDRNHIAALVIELCLREIFHFRMMQTDPNWTNFLWNATERRLGLVDFGATREYGEEFVEGWGALLRAAAEGDWQACVDHSVRVGYLTGGESQIMLDAHVKSMSLLATPFKRSTPQPFSFRVEGVGENTDMNTPSPSSTLTSFPSPDFSPTPTPIPTPAWGTITAEIRAQIPVMIQHRLTPPPRETYSLNRKLSGAFLLAARLGAEVDTRAVWEGVLGKGEDD